MTRFTLQLLTATALSAFASAAYAGPNSNTLQINGMNNSLAIKQIGSDNALTGHFAGSGNTLKLNQSGSGNTIDLKTPIGPTSNSLLTATTGGTNNKTNVQFIPNQPLETTTGNNVSLNTQGISNSDNVTVGGNNVRVTHSILGNDNDVRSATGENGYNKINISGHSNDVYMYGYNRMSVAPQSNARSLTAIISGNSNLVSASPYSTNSTAKHLVTGNGNRVVDALDGNGNVINSSSTGNDNQVGIGSDYSGMLQTANQTKGSFTANGSNNQINATFSPGYNTGASAGMTANGNRNKLLSTFNQTLGTSSKQTANGDDNRLTFTANNTNNSASTLSSTLAVTGNNNELIGTQQNVINAKIGINTSGFGNRFEIGQTGGSDNKMNVVISGNDNESKSDIPYYLNKSIQDNGVRNTGDIKITGNNNDVVSVQSLTDDSNVKLTVNGSGHEVFALQGSDTPSPQSSRNALNATIDGTANRLNTRQQGSNNSMLLKMVGSNNYVYAGQKGDGNIVDLTAQGVNNELVTHQEGTGNILTVGTFNATGIASGNRLYPNQNGSDNRMKLYVQNGQNNTLIATQNGTGNTMDVTFRNGSGNTGTFLQEGTNLNYTLVSTASNTPYNIVQRN